MKDDVLPRVLLFTSHFDNSSRDNANKLNDQIIGIMEVCRAKIAHQFPNENLQKNQTELMPTIPGVESIVVEIVPIKYLETTSNNDTDPYQEIKKYINRNNIRSIFIEGEGNVVQKLRTKLPGKGIMHIKTIKGRLAILQKYKGKTTKVYHSEKLLSP